MSPNSQHLVYHSTNMLNCKATQKLQRAINLPWHLLNWRMLKSLHRRAGHYWGMDICFRDSFLSLQHSQENLCPTSSLGARLNRSKHLMSVDTLELIPATLLSPLRACGFEFATPRQLLLPESKSKEMSMQGSNVVDENPQFVQVTSDLRIPENTRCAMQQSPSPIMSTK